MTFVSFPAADQIGDRFLDLLSRHGVNPPVRSAVEAELLSLTELIQITTNPNLANGPNEAVILRAASGLHDLAAKVLSLEGIPEFNAFLPHLRLIAEAKAHASLAQNAASGPFDDTARKMAELYLGCLVAHVGTQVALDSPTAAKGDNPDIIFTLQPNHQPALRWALAIKTIASQHGQTIFERIREGAQQIDNPKCLADKGMVVINTKSALDHNALWRKPFKDLQAAIAALREQINNLVARAEANRPQLEWDSLFGGKVVRPVLFLGQSLVRIPTPAGGETPTPLKMLASYPVNGQVEPVAFNLGDQLNTFMQEILLGVPGSPGKLPR
jgi:hypothetical protein